LKILFSYRLTYIFQFLFFLILAKLAKEIHQNRIIIKINH